MPEAPQRPADPKQRWMAFVRNHAKAIVASDFFVVVTATFQLVYVFVIIEVVTRRVVHSTSLDIRPQIGRYSNFENASLETKDIDSSSMIGIVSILTIWTLP
jgi:hypothetical protein